MKVMAVFAALVAIVLGILFWQLPKRQEAGRGQVSVSGTTFQKPKTTKAAPSNEAVAAANQNGDLVIRDSGASIAMMPASKKPVTVVTESEFKAKSNQK